MKYVVEWHTRPGASSAENLATSKRSLEVLSKWTPGGTMHAFLQRVDGNGGFAITESDDPAVVFKDCAIFAPFLEMSIHPVMEMEAAVGVMQQALDFTEHA